MSFKVKGADGKPIVIEDGDFYFNTKARARRMMLNSLSSDARRVYACLELATMGFQQELAVTMEGGKIRNLSPSDVSRQTKLPKQKVRDAFEELEDEGLAKRETDDGGALRRGHIRLYSWAEPHPTRPKIKEVAPRGYFPSWFPDSWEPLRPLINRYRYSLIEDEVAARDYFEEGAEVARSYQNAEMVAARFLERVRAQRKTLAPLLNERTERTSEITLPPPPPFVSSEETEEEEDRTTAYQKFKAAYPAGRFDEPKTKPSFEKKSKTEQTRILERLQAYRSCERWKDDGGRWIPFSSKWLESYEAEPPPSLKKAQAATGGVDAERLRRIAANVEEDRKWR